MRVTAIQASAAWSYAEHALCLRFYLTAGAAARLVMPPAHATPSPRDGLWRHTCFEAFVSDTETRAYHEFNFSPSGDWAAYAFADTRVRDAARELLPAPHAAWTRGADGLRLDARIGMATLPSLPVRAGAGLRVGLSAVLEHEEDHAQTPLTALTPLTRLTHWALAHPKPAPDFHDRTGWTLLIPAP